MSASIFPLTLHTELDLLGLMRHYHKVIKEEEKNGEEIISIHSIAKERERSYDTIKRWIDDRAIKVYAYGAGGGKGIKRKDLNKLP